MKITSRILVCVLGAIFIFSSLGAVYAVDPSPSPTPGYELDDGLPNVFESLVPYYVWLCMRAWGIEVSYKNFREYTNEVGQQIWEWIIEYLASLPSSYTIDQWIAPWQSSYDYWGNYQFNNSALEDIQDFVQWLISKLSLTDNSTYYVDGNETLGGYTLYKPEIYYVINNPTDNKVYLYTITQKLSNWAHVYDIYLMYAVINNEVKSCWVTSNTYSNCRSEVDYYDSSFNFVSSSGGLTEFNHTSQSGIKYSDLNTNSGPYPNGNWFNGSMNEFTSMIDNASIEVLSDYALLIGDINLPVSDINYTDGVSIVIIGDKPSYQIIEWSGEVTVSNLPAIVSSESIPTPGDELNPGLVNAWHPISTLIEMTTESMGMLIGIVYEFPEEVLIPIFAVLGGIIIFGIIHAMKEH